MNEEVDIKFKSLEELYQRLTPALKSKVRELNQIGFNNIIELDIWEFLKEVKWSNSKSLDLGEMVNDIFSLNKKKFSNYIKEKMDENVEVLDENL